MQATGVLRIFRDYASGLSPRAIAAALNSEGVPSPRGGGWNDSTIRGNAKKRDGLLRNEAYVGQIVYGRNQWFRDPETGHRLSRPDEAEDIVYVERSELRIIDDEVWNAVQARLEATYAQFTEVASHAPSAEATPLNASHRAKYLLAHLLTCGTCGGAYTIMGKDRYGCYNRRTKGTAVCSNSKTITRQKIEDRVLARVRQGLLTPELAWAFAAEVGRQMEARAAEVARQDRSVAPKLADLDRRIERLLDQIEGGASDAASLRSRLAQREAERAALRTSATAPSMLVAIPTPADLEGAFAEEARRLDRLLGTPSHVVEANDLLRQLIAAVRLWPDPDAPDGLRAEVEGDLSWVPWESS